MDPIWEEVRAIQIVPRMTGLVRTRDKELSEERMLRLMQGCLTSLAALRGLWTFAEAWERARPQVAAQFEERGRSFTALACDRPLVGSASACSTAALRTLTEQRRW